MTSQIFPIDKFQREETKQSNRERSLMGRSNNTSHLGKGGGQPMCHATFFKTFLKQNNATKKPL